MNLHDKLSKLSGYIIFAIVFFGLGYMQKPNEVKKTTSIESESAANLAKKSSAELSSTSVGTASKVSIKQKGSGKKKETEIIIDNAKDLELQDAVIQELLNAQETQKSSVLQVLEEKKFSKGAGFMADFDKENKFEGYVLDGHYGYGKAALDFNEAFKYNGWKMGIQFNF